MAFPEAIRKSIEAHIRDVEDFPKKGIVFKDIVPLLSQPKLCNQVTIELAKHAQNVDAVVGIEARGFLFGMLLANHLEVPFVPVRKSGKLPYKTLQESYDLEYGSATVEIHQDAILPGQRMLVHDDLLATGGTAAAAARLIQQLGGEIAAFSFLIELTFLNGREPLGAFGATTNSVLSY